MSFKNMQEFDFLVNIDNINEEDFFLKISNDFILEKYSKLNTNQKNQLKNIVGNRWSQKIANLEKNNIFYLKIKNLLNIEEYNNKETEFINKLKEKIRKSIVVGCGTNPESAFQLKTVTSEIITCIDLDNSSILKCQTKFSDKKIKFRLGNGKKNNYQNYDLIFLVNGLYNKEEILKRVFATGKKTAIILMRNPIYTGELLYEKVEKIEIEKYFIIDHIIQSSKLGNTMVLRIKS